VDEGVVGTPQALQHRIEGGPFGAIRPVEVAQERQPFTAEDKRLESLVDPGGEHD